MTLDTPKILRSSLFLFFTHNKQAPGPGDSSGCSQTLDSGSERLLHRPWIESLGTSNQMCHPVLTAEETLFRERRTLQAKFMAAHCPLKIIIRRRSTLSRRVCQRPFFLPLHAARSSQTQTNSSSLSTAEFKFPEFKLSFICFFLSFILPLQSRVTLITPPFSIYYFHGFHLFWDLVYTQYLL